MGSDLPTMMLVVGVLGAGAILFMKRCELLGVCDDQPLPPPPPPAPAPAPEEDEDPEVTNQTVIINAEGQREYVPVPVAVPGRPVIVHPYPYPAPPRCASRISRHGAIYTLTSMSRMPDVMTMQFPPSFIKEGRCIYQLLRGPIPAPIPPKPKPVEISRSCCKCKTTGFDNEVRCSHDNGKTWSTNQRYKYDLQSSMNECVKKCRPNPTSRIDIDLPYIDIDIGWDKKCSDPYCQRFPSRCPHCTQSKANYGALQTNRMSIL